MNSPLRPFIIVAFAALVLSHNAAAQDAKDTPKTKVRTATVQTIKMSPTLDVPGSVVSLHNSKLSAEAAATVDWVAEVGTPVEKGAAVAKLNTRLLQLDLINSQADMARIKAQLQFRTKDVARLTKLLNSQSIPESRFDEAVSQKAVLQQELAQAGARRDRITYLLEKSEIKAPAAGVVVERYISVGEYVESGVPVVRFIDTQNSEITVQVPLNLLPNISQGMQVTVSNGNTIVTAPIRAIVPVGDNVSRMAEIRLVNPDKIWVIGTAVRVSIPNAAPRKVLAVPRDALIIRAGQSYIYKIAKDNKAERVHIRPGVTNATQIEVTGRLNEGDKVVTRGGETLQPGQEVEILAVS